MSNNSAATTAQAAPHVSVPLVNVTFDGVSVQVPKGMNLIEAARVAGVEIPHYCYHPDLSIAGNCRMCQCQVGDSGKMSIACNTTAAEGMVVKTQQSSEAVANAQRATLEFLLINHPLDCTVCDQAGHCKLQDYYYEYNTKPSRFIEEKVNKVKAEVFGPEVIYDGERCIVCTRCVRFCDEVTETSELGVLNRGDKSLIAIHPDRELNNPLSGSVVDLCPVGALTHRQWRFNTRIWYTQEQDTICTGCSTGCNANVAVRDGEVVHVKARYNPSVNKEWMCDEGRYGFGRFIPEDRLSQPHLRSNESFVVSSWEEALKTTRGLVGSDGGHGDAAIFLAPDLSLEDVWSALLFAERVMKVPVHSGQIALQLRKRELTKEEAVLISPDYAPNARALQLFGFELGQSDWRETLERGYDALLTKVRAGSINRVVLVGERAILSSDTDSQLAVALHQAATSVALTPKGLKFEGADSNRTDVRGAQMFVNTLLPVRTVHERSGTMVNKDLRLQRIKGLFTAPFGAIPDWMALQRVAKSNGTAMLKEDIVDDRALFRFMVAESERPGSLFSQEFALRGLTLKLLGDRGLSFDELRAANRGDSQGSAGVAPGAVGSQTSV